MVLSVFYTSGWLNGSWCTKEQMKVSLELHRLPYKRRSAFIGHLDKNSNGTEHETPTLLQTLYSESANAF